jgi:fructose-bisphosphate aldolase class I
MIPTIQEIASNMMASNKGILAADESASTMNKRLRSIQVAETEENGRRFRDLLFTAPDVEKYLSGVILFDATIRQRSNTGEEFPRLLESKGIIPGIKVDAGVEPLPNFGNEVISRGLDGLRLRLKEYYALGARFTKWRSVIEISEETPTDVVIDANMHVLAQYAGIVQEANMVPMVEPEVLFNGTHTLERSGEVLEKTLNRLFEMLKEFRVSLPSLILKTSMALPGRESGIAFDPYAIARETVRVLKTTVPKETAGVVFLSGGQTPVQATENLNAIIEQGEMPWPVTFSYSRALEEPVLEAWKGEDKNTKEAQNALIKRLSLNVKARNASYKKEME